MTPTLRDSTTVGPYRIEVWEDDGARVEVHQLDAGGRWKLARGPFRFPTLDAGLAFAEDIRTGLRERIRREA